MQNARVYHGGSNSRGSWPSSSGLSPAIIALLSTTSALPILTAISNGYLAVKDHTTPTAAVAGYDLLYNAASDGAMKVEYPDTTADTFDLSPGVP